MSTASKSALPPPELRFLENVSGLCQLTKDVVSEAQTTGVTVPVQPFVIDIADAYLRRVDPNIVINTFILRSFPHWKEVKAKNVDFFRSATKTLFQGVPEEHVEAFVRLYDTVKPDGTRVIDKEREEEYFAFFRAMIKQCICYIHQQRQPDPTTKKYTRAAYSEIEGVKVSVKALVEEWEIKQLH